MGIKGEQTCVRDALQDKHYGISSEEYQHYYSIAKIGQLPKPTNEKTILNSDTFFLFILLQPKVNTFLGEENILFFKEKNLIKKIKVNVNVTQFNEPMLIGL